jgi:hypothetical protein
MGSPEERNMRVYLAACCIAAIIAIGAVFVLNSVQETAQVAFSTSGVRLDHNGT